MKCRKLTIKIKDGDCIPYIYSHTTFHVEDNMIIVEELSNCTICFPMENVLYYEFEKYQ